MVKKILLIITAVIMVFSTFLLVGCSKKVSDFTEEEHIQRVTERIEKRYMTNEANHTSFNVYPLYNEKDELNYFLVEFEPYGFIYVLLRDEQLKAFSWLGASTSMYVLSSSADSWSPYRIDETNSQPYPNTDKIWEKDENGNIVKHNKSPFSIAGIESEQRYLFNIDNQYIIAVKRNGKFINLISQEEVEIMNGHLTKKQAYLLITFNEVKKNFNL